MQTWLDERRQRWADRRIVRAKRRAVVKSLVARACVFAAPVLGAMLISYGAWLVYAPAGYITGGVLLVLLEQRIETELLGGDE